jgi:hypothetical protein
MTNASALEVQSMREEAILSVVRVVTQWCRHHKSVGNAQPTEQQLAAACQIERILCETARALVACDDAYRTIIEAEVALTTQEGSETVN